MKRWAMAAAIVALFGQYAAAQQPLRVYVTTKAPENGFVDDESKARNDMKPYLSAQIRKKKNLFAIAGSENQADMVIEITLMELVDGALRSGIDPIRGGVTTQAQKEFRTVVVLRVGDYSTEFSEQNRLAAVTAVKLGDDVERWAKENKDRLNQKIGAKER